MRQLLPILALLLLACAPAQAQEKTIDARDVQTIAELLEKSKVFMDYRRFRRDIEEMTIEAGQGLYYTEDHLRLNAAYNDIQARYNDLLQHIKKDLSNLTTIRLMTKKPQDFALRYLDDYNQVIDAYETNYLPIYREVTQPSRSSMKQGKAISPTLIILGVEVFMALVDLIQSRKGDQETSENAVLAKVNEFFVKKLRMKPWDELALTAPDKVAPGTSTITRKPQKIAPTKMGRNVLVQTSLVEKLSGTLEFKFLDANAKPQSMVLAKGKGKNLGVEVLRAQKGKVEGEGRLVQLPEFETSFAFKEGTQFQLLAKNTGGMYVFSLNSGNKIQFLYPYANENLRDCAQKLGTGKDLDVLPATFVVGRNAKGETVLPAPDCSTTSPTPRYFTIQPPMPKSGVEQFCVLLTKSEMDTKLLAKLLEKEEGDLGERVLRVLAADIVRGTDWVKNKGGKISFDTKKQEGTVLPVLFTIQRK